MRCRLAASGLALILAALSPAVGGCGSAGPTTVSYPTGEYEAAFDAAREALLEFDFTLDRVDARRGIITTRPEATAGLATPWDRAQRTFSQEWEDFANEQNRRVEVRFRRPTRPAGAGDRQPAGDQAEVRTAESTAAKNLPRENADVANGETAAPTASVARFRVILYRVNKPGLSLESEAIGLSGRWIDPLYDPATRNARDFLVPLREDRKLAAELAARAAIRMNSAEAGETVPAAGGE